MYRRLFAGLLVICMLFLCACDTVIPPQTDNPEQPTQSLEPEQTPAPHTTVPTPSVTSSETVPEGTGSDIVPDSDEPGGSVTVREHTYIYNGIATHHLFVFVAKVMQFW